MPPAFWIPSRRAVQVQGGCAPSRRREARLPRESFARWSAAGTSLCSRDVWQPSAWVPHRGLPLLWGGRGRAVWVVAAAAGRRRSQKAHANGCTGWGPPRWRAGAPQQSGGLTASSCTRGLRYIQSHRVWAFCVSSEAVEATITCSSKRGSRDQGRLRGVDWSLACWPVAGWDPLTAAPCCSGELPRR